jgi:ATP-dependent RNA circularization protein (DNA/RNA ligase family)
MKYPRTQHLPWSNGGSVDDLRMIDTSHFNGKTLVYTEKLDGENTVMTRENIHARSETGYSKPWQTFLKAKWASFKFEIPEGMEICGENLYAVHSIEYGVLPSVFFVFNIFMDDFVLSVPEMIEWANLLNLPIVPIIKYGPIEELEIPTKSSFGKECEGYVVRNIESFKIQDFSKNVAKCVREDHVQTNAHWTKTWKKSNFLP